MNAAEQALYNVVPDVFRGEPTSPPTCHSSGDRVIPVGERNSTLASLAGHMRKPGFSTEAIAAALRVENMRCADPLPEREVEQIAHSIGRYPAGISPEPMQLRTFTLPQLEAHQFDQRRVLLYRGDTAIVREGYLGELFALRGTGKTWLAQTLGVIAATGAEALGFRADEPASVLHIDGEMAGPELQERYASIGEKLRVPPTPNLTIIAADWQDGFLPRLDTAEGQHAVEPFVNVADFIIIDNRSTLFDPEAEKDPSAWQPAQDWLLSLRRRKKAVLIVHHSNRQGGARGHSKPEDVMNLLIKLSRPDGYTADQGARFTLEFEKARGAHGAAVAPFTASLQADGWHIENTTETDTATRKLVEYLDAAHQAGERPKSASKAITSARIGKSAGLKAWAALKANGALKQHPEGGFYLG